MLDDVGMSSDRNRNRNRPCAGDGSYEDSTLYLHLLQDSGMTTADSQFCLLYGLGVHGLFPLFVHKLALRAESLRGTQSPVHGLRQNSRAAAPHWRVGKIPAQ